MATSDIYETTFDEDVQQETTTNQCPECDGRVTTNVSETVCEDCGLVIDEQRIDHGPEWRSFDKDQRERTGAPLTVARHDRGLSTEIGRWTDANGNTLPGRKRRQLGHEGGCKHLRRIDHDVSGPALQNSRLVFCRGASQNPVIKSV